MILAIVIMMPNDLKAVVAVVVVVVVRGGSGRMELCICSLIIWIECCGITFQSKTLPKDNIQGYL